MILLAFLKQDILEIIIQRQQQQQQPTFRATKKHATHSGRAAEAAGAGGLRVPAAINHRTPNAGSSRRCIFENLQIIRRTDACSVGRSNGWLVGWLAGWLAAWLAAWLERWTGDRSLGPPAALHLLSQRCQKRPQRKRCAWAEPATGIGTETEPEPESESEPSSSWSWACSISLWSLIAFLDIGVNDCCSLRLGTQRSLRRFVRDTRSPADTASCNSSSASASTSSRTLSAPAAFP